MKLKVKALKRAMVVEVPEVKTAKKRNSTKDLSPCVKRYPNQQYRDLEKVGYKLFGKEAEKKCKNGKEFYAKVREDIINGLKAKIYDYTEELKGYTAQLEDFLKDDDTELKNLMIAAFEREIEVSSEDVHETNQKKVK